MANNKKYSIEESLKALGQDINKLSKEIEARAKTSLQILATQAYNKIIEKVNKKLRSTRQMYLDALELKPEGDNLWMITLNKTAAFIEDGSPAGERIDEILNGGKPAKVSKKGDKYKVIPFEHSKAPSQQSLAQLRIASYAKDELKKRGLDKPIKGADGKPAIGKVATVNLIGPDSPKGKQGQPLLAGLTIYQKKTKSGKIKRDVMTFRIISESQKGSGKWVWPEKAGVKFFDEVSKELEADWDKIIKDIVDELKVE